MDSKAWSLLNPETLQEMRENLIGTYHKYVGKFIQWANEKKRLELVSGKLVDYITQIWCRQKLIDEKPIDENLWNLLNSEEVLAKLSDKDCLKLIDIHWRLDLDLDSSSLTLPNLYERAKNFSLKEKKSLKQVAQEISRQCNDVQSLKKLIQKWKNFYDYPELLEIIFSAKFDITGKISMNEIRRGIS